MLTIHKMHTYAELFSLGEKTGCELNETAGIMSDPKTYTERHGANWYDGLTIQAAIGQCDDMFTPIELAEYCAMIANGGTRYKTHFLNKVTDYDRAAAAAADCALIVCNSDPVCIRDASIVRRLLTELEVPQQRLVINRFNAEYFGSLSAGREDAGGLRDLDDVIDQSGVRLIGIVPEDRQMTAAFQRGCVPADDLPGMTALSRIAARMNGVSVPLSL